MPDFAEKSKYKPNRGRGEVQEPLLGAYYDARAKDPTGLYEDVVYDSVNGDEQATRWAKRDAGLAYEDVPEDAVKIFNYLYETQGKEAAHEYIRQVKDPYYSVFQSFMMGVGEGAGVTSLAKTFGGKDVAEDLDQRSAESRRAHPAASTAGNAGGTVATALLLNRLLGNSRHPILSGAASMGGTTAIQGLGDVVVGRTDLEDYALNVLGNTAGGAVGSAAAMGATNLGTKVLFKTGLQNNIFANAINQGTGGVAFSVGNAVTRGAIDPNYNPTADEMKRDAAVTFAFQTITSAVRLAGRTDQAKAALEQDVAVLKRDFETIAKAEMTGEITPTDTIERMKVRSATLRVTIEGTRYIGQGKKVDEALAFLDQMDDFLAEATKHNAKTVPDSGVDLDSSTTATEEFTSDQTGGIIQTEKEPGTIEMPNYKHAITPAEKFIKYSLDYENPKALGKPESYERGLGYTKENAEGLIEQIHTAIISGKVLAFDTQVTPYGIKYRYRIAVHKQKIRRLCCLAAEWIKYTPKVTCDAGKTQSLTLVFRRAWK